MPVDVDYVPHEPKAPSNPTCKPPKLQPLPKFAPIEIEGAPEHGNADLPWDVNIESPYEIFSLFFDDFIMEVLVNNTNAYAKAHSPMRTHKHPKARVWKPTSVPELRAFIGSHIWIGLHPEAAIEDFWNTDEKKGPLHRNLTKHMSLTRWQQLDRFFHISPPNDHAAFIDQSVYDKLDPLSEHLRTKFKEYWTTGTHLTVDETMSRFMGRTAEIVNIPSKPIPEGYKIWVLANGGYVLDWLYHTRGDGPVDLDEYWTWWCNLPKTQALVCELVKQQGIHDDCRHMVWMDNLFTSAELLRRLKKEGFGAAGTARTTKTAREESEAVSGTAGQKETLKEPNRGIPTRIAELKTMNANQLEWGTLQGALTDDGEVIVFAWKDSNVVIFMSTVHDGQSKISRKRRRPAATSTSAKTARARFGDCSVKVLNIPTFIDLYNHYMNGVDTADQIRSYYTTQRTHRKTWKPLWHFLLDTAVCNAYKLINTSHMKPYTDQWDTVSHKRFRMELANQLFEASAKVARQKPLEKALDRKVRYLPHRHHQNIVRLAGDKKNCASCVEAGRHTVQGTKRKPFDELSSNTTKRTNQRPAQYPRSVYGCDYCHTHLCQYGTCFKEHLDKVDKKS